MAGCEIPMGPVPYIDVRHLWDWSHVWLKDTYGRAPTLEFRLKTVKFRPISDQILREIQTKSDHFLGKFGLYA